MEKVLVYGADWCSMTKRSLKLLDESGVEYKYTDIDNDPAGAAWVREHNSDGKERKPTIQIGGEILIEPSNDELTESLRNNNLV